MPLIGMVLLLFAIACRHRTNVLSIDTERFLLTVVLASDTERVSQLS